MTTATMEKKINELPHRGSFIPYYQFANSTIGLLFKCITNGKTYTRINLWSREYENTEELTRIMTGNSTTYVPFDKPGWKDGRLLMLY
jgi:hypothetical protein